MLIPDLWILYIVSALCFFLFFILLSGFRKIDPNCALVVLFCGKYLGTIKETGFFFINPYYAKYPLSTKTMNFETPMSKVNDANGTPIEIQIVVVWRI
jgi:regulator of protease activity HflC (stomatin/prohibitin superfamily)